MDTFPLSDSAFRKKFKNVKLYIHYSFVTTDGQRYVRMCTATACVPI